MTPLLTVFRRSGPLALAAILALSSAAAAQQDTAGEARDEGNQQAVVVPDHEPATRPRTGRIGVFDTSPSPLYAGANTVFTVSFTAPNQQPELRPGERGAETSGATQHRSPFGKLIDRARSMGSFEGSPTGFYPQATTIYPGGSLAFGAGYKYPLGSRTNVDVNGAWSLQNFKRLEATMSLPLDRGDNPRLSGAIEAGWMDAPEVAFYGIGNDTPDEEMHFAYRPTTVGLSVAAIPWRHLKFAGGAHYVAIDAVTEVVGADAALARLDASPVLAGAPRYLRSQGVVEVNWLSTDGYRHSGGMYRLTLQDHADRSASQLSFRSVEGEVVQFVPIIHESWGLAFHGLLTITDDGTADRVPVYLLPSLGGNNSIRGYPSFRFRDRHRMLLTAESRWRASKFLELALFYDGGKVARETDDLNLDGLRYAYGVGARFINIKRTVFRVEVARNDQDSWRLVWSTRTSF